MKSFGHIVVLWMWIFGSLNIIIRAALNDGASTSTSRNNESTFVPGSAAVTRGRVMLTISARNLIGRDYLSKSDPMCVIFGRSFDGSRWTEHGRTETIQDNHQPDFVTKITLDYHFEVMQPLRFEIYDIDESSADLSRHDFLGFAKCNLAKLVHERKVELVLNPHKSEINMTDNEIHERRRTMTKKPSLLRATTGDYKEPSKIIIRAEVMKSADEANDNLIIIELKGRNLAGSAWYSLNKPNPYVDIYKAINKEATDYVLVYRTEMITFSSRPHWRRFLIFFSALASEDRDRKLKFVCRNSRRMSDHGYIGEFLTTVAEIEGAGKKNFYLIDPKKQNTSNYENSGFLRFETFKKMKTASFLEYVAGNLDVNCIIAIDFTSSNGNPANANSLHRIYPAGSNRLNQYEQAITAVVSILEDYDSDKLFPVFGYGANFPETGGRVSHIFPVNFNAANPNCEKVDGVLTAYRACLQRVQLDGPTYFNKVIKHAVNMAREYKQGKNYAILLILTDGEIHDMDATVRTIVKASKLPLSIIIVGVGNANFANMEELDADGAPLEWNGKRAKRDIVQFVPFNKFFKQGDVNDPLAKVRLAGEVLAEVPKQLITYMTVHKFKPRLRRTNTGDMFANIGAAKDGQPAINSPPDKQSKGTSSDLPSTSKPTEEDPSSTTEFSESKPSV